MAKKTKKDETIPFEEAMKQLENLVDLMEKGELSLEDSLQTFEEGVKLTRICQSALKEAEQKVQMLSQTSPEGDLESFNREL